MRRLVTAAVLAGVAVGLTVWAASTQAQPPGFKGKFGPGFGKGGDTVKSKEGDRKDTERKEGERKEAERKESDRKEAGRPDAERRPERPPAAERIRHLERELAETHARLHLLMHELVQAHIELMHEHLARGQAGVPFGPMGPGFAGPRFGGPFLPGAPPGPATPGAAIPQLPLERMSPEQIKELIQRLQKVLEERTRERKESEQPKGRTERKEADKGKAEGQKKDKDDDDKREALEKRLQQLLHEVELLRQELQRRK
ncbi:MAG: hypothetical protein NZU63_03050 [Gemmataceae bacterium]|nr:hypothetical protein [Gemmataceae bacterium]MDW8241845.1 hypothetical protein [Thermogemmata sp.]